MRLQDLDCVVSHRRLLPAVSIRREIHHREVCASDLRHRERNRREDAPRHARSAALPARRRVHLRDPRALQTGRGLTKGLVAIVRLAGSQWIQMLERRASLVGCLCMHKEKREQTRNSRPGWREKIHCKDPFTFIFFPGMAMAMLHAWVTVRTCNRAAVPYCGYISLAARPALWVWPATYVCTRGANPEHTRCAAPSAHLMPFDEEARCSWLGTLRVGALTANLCEPCICLGNRLR